MVSTSPTELGGSVVSTILVKATPFADDEVAAFTDQSAEVTDGVVRHVPGQPSDGGVVASILTLPDGELDSWYDGYEFDVRPITDDAPYFWNFARYTDVVRQIDEPIDSVDPEAGTGERVLLLLLGVALLFALVFLIVPFLAIRKEWKALPRKPVSALYFTCLGMGFLFFEITLIQRLTLFLGYPTYSLTVTLAWGWAVNGFASVVGSVLTTLLSMTFGFRAVMVIALGVYAVAVVALRSLMASPPHVPDDLAADAEDDEPALVPT